MENEIVTMTKKKFDEIALSLMRLEALEAAGIDNWSGYDHAMEILAEMVEDQK